MDVRCPGTDAEIQAFTSAAMQRPRLQRGRLL